MSDETKPQDDPAVAEELKGVPEDLLDQGEDGTLDRLRQRWLADAAVKRDAR